MLTQALEFPGPGFSPGLLPCHLGDLGQTLTCLITGILPGGVCVALEMNVRCTACAWYGEIALSLSHGGMAESPLKGRGRAAEGRSPRH